MAITDTLRRWAWSVTTRAVGFPPEWHDKVLDRIANGVGTGGPGHELDCSALTASVRILSTVLSTAPLGVYRVIPDGFELAPEHELHRIISKSPNDRMTSAEWRRQMITRMLLYRNGSIDQILLNAKDEVIGLNPLDPNKVRIDDDGPQRVFIITQKNGSVVTLKSEEVLHIPYLFEGDPLGVHAARAIELALSADQFAQRFFKSGGMQQLALETDQTVGPDKKREIVEQFHKNLLEGKIPFTDSGTKLKPLNVKFEEVQLKDTRTFQSREVQRVIGVQPHLTGDLERSTNNNIEHQGIEFVNFTCEPLAIAIEQRLDMSLFGRREGNIYCARHDLTKLKQADYESTADGVARMVAAGVMTPNEARRRVGLNPHPEGGNLLIQGAMVPIADVGKQKEEPDVRAA